MYKTLLLPSYPYITNLETRVICKFFKTWNSFPKPVPCQICVFQLYTFQKSPCSERIIIFKDIINLWNWKRNRFIPYWMFMNFDEIRAIIFEIVPTVGHENNVPKLQKSLFCLYIGRKKRGNSHKPHSFSKKWNPFRKAISGLNWLVFKLCKFVSFGKSACWERRTIVKNKKKSLKK